MGIKQQLEELSKELEEALIFNKPLLPVLLKCNERLISVHFDPHPEWNPELMKFRLVRQGTESLAYIEFYINPETVMTSEFYPKEV
jgi:hypothetical protein